MKITHWRDTQGKFAKKRRQRGNVKIVLLLIVIALIAILGYKANWTSYEPVDLKMEEVRTHELTPEQEAQLKKQYELSIKETALKNKKAKLDAEYKSQSDSLEAELESIRAQKVSFQ